MCNDFGNEVVALVVEVDAVDGELLIRALMSGVGGREEIDEGCLVFLGEIGDGIAVEGDFGLAFCGSSLDSDGGKHDDFGSRVDLS